MPLAGVLAVAAVAFVAIGLIAMALVHARAACCGAADGVIIFADQVTAEEGGNPNPPAGLVGRADQLAANGGGKLVLIRAAGQSGVQAGPPVSLLAYREPGQLEHDPVARRIALQRVIDKAFREARATPAPGAGRDVIGMLATISSELGSGRGDVWLSTLGLPTVDPADARVLMAADPAQAVASIAGVPSLRGARVRLILAPPAGNQPRFNVRTDAWRRAFMVALVRRTGADLVSINEVETVESPAPGAQPAPVIPNLADPTPVPPAIPQPHAPYVAKLDNSAIFQPDSAQFASGPATILAGLEPIIAAWRTGSYSRVSVVGHTARFGPAGTARLLSLQRATKVAELLEGHGVSVVTAKGVGYDQPLPPSPTDAANRVVIVTAYPKN